MNNIIKRMLPAVAAIALLASCDSVMDDKDVIDASFQKGATAAPTVTLVSATAPEADQMLFTATVSDTTDVMESGIMISQSEDFAQVVTLISETNTNNITAEYNKCEGNIKYYVRAYAVMKSGTTAVSETKVVTTPKPYVFTIDGNYEVSEYELDDDDNWAAEDGTYPLTITFVEGSTTEVEITGIWGYDIPVDGIYDAETQTVTIPSQQQIGEHATYGPIYIRGVNEAITAYTSAITLSFNPAGGKMTSSPFAVYVSAGTFGYYRMNMQHIKE